MIEFIAETVVADIQKNGSISIADDRQLAGLIVHIIEEEFDREEELDDEVREIMADHYQEIRSGGLNYDEVFRKIKSKLARDKGIVL